MYAMRKYLLFMALMVTVGLSLVGLASDVSNTIKYGGVDLRNRVVGARLLLKGLDPYHFKWTEEYPETLLDPLDNPEEEVNRVTVTPSLLVLHAPLAPLPYRLHRYSWLALQWLFLLGCAFLVARTSDSSKEKLAAWIIALLISISPFWRFHVERGQVYVLYAFLLFIAFWAASHRSRLLTRLSGPLLGLLATLRPTFVFFLVPLLVFRKWKLAGGMILGIVATLIFFLPLAGVQTWKSYASAMDEHGKENLGLYRPLADSKREAEIEGMTNLGSFMPFPVINTSIQLMAKRKLHKNLNSTDMGILMMITIALAGLSLLPFRHKSPSLPLLFLLGSLFILVSEYFLPAVKTSYVNVLWLIPGEMMLLELNRMSSVSAWKRAVTLVLLASAVLLNALVFSFAFNAIWAEALTILTFVWFAFCCLSASPANEIGDGDVARIKPVSRESRGIKVLSEKDVGGT